MPPALRSGSGGLGGYGMRKRQAKVDARLRRLNRHIEGGSLKLLPAARDLVGTSRYRRSRAVWVRPTCRAWRRRWSVGTGVLRPRKLNARCKAARDGGEKHGCGAAADVAGRCSSGVPDDPFRAVRGAGTGTPTRCRGTSSLPDQVRRVRTRLCGGIAQTHRDVHRLTRCVAGLVSGGRRHELRSLANSRRRHRGWRRGYRRRECCWDGYGRWNGR